MSYYIHQLEETDCGFACLKMIVAQVNHDESFLFIPNPQPKVAFSFLELSHVGEKYGITMEGYKISDKKEAKNIKTPFIAHCLMEGSNHFVIVSKVKCKGFKILDPKNGIYWLADEAFFTCFTGMLLVVTHTEPSKIKPMRFNPVSKWERFFLHVFQLLSFFCLLVALYFVNEENEFIYPLVFFVAYFALEIFYKKLLLWVSRRFDQKMIVPVIDKIVNETKTNLAFLYDFKTSVIVSPLGFLGQLAAVLAIAIVMTFNAWGNIIIVVGCLGLAILECYLMKPFFQKEVRSMARLENEMIKNIERREPVEVALADLNKKSYRYALLDETKKYISWFLLLIGCLVSMAISGIASINYLIFHFMFFSYLLDNVRSLLDYGRVRLKIRDAKNRYLSLSE